METIYLPGDREVVALAEAIARDKRLNQAEILAKLSAYRCNVRKWDAVIYSDFYGPWRCTFREPCIYCGDLR
jgi:hypothetical protein